MSNSNTIIDIMIIGSGVIGSALGCVLAKDGYRVTIIERDLSEPHRIVGELLQPGGVLALEELGLKDCLDNIARKMVGYVIHRDDSAVEIPYDQEAVTFEHGKFIMALRKRAADEKNVTYIQGRASKLIESNGIIEGVEYVDINNERKKIYSEITVICDGCFSNFRKQLSTTKPHQRSFFAGLVLTDASEIKDNYAEICLTSKALILMYKLDEKRTRVLVDMQIKPKKLYDFFSSIILQLPYRLRDPFRMAIENQTAKIMPNFYMPAIKHNKIGVVCLGDAMNMRHPLTGAGMTVALKDAVLFRNCLRKINGLDRLEISKSLSRLRQERKSHSIVVNTLSMALYEIFAGIDNDSNQLQQACFNYFKLGGNCVAGPVSMLTVLEPKPIKLVMHFFAVAFYAIYRNPWNSFKLLRKACTIITPLLFTEMFN